MNSTIGPNEKPLYCCSVTKYDRHGYKPRPRILIVTSSATYLFDSKDGKLKQKILHNQLQGNILVTNFLVVLNFKEQPILTYFLS